MEEVQIFFNFFFKEKIDTIVSMNARPWMMYINYAKSTVNTLLVLAVEISYPEMCEMRIVEKNPSVGSADNYGGTWTYKPVKAWDPA